QVLGPNPGADDSEACVRTLVRAREDLTANGMHTEHAEVVRADWHRPDALGLRPIGQVGSLDAVGVLDGDIQSLALFPVRDGSQSSQVAVVVAACRVIDTNEALWLDVRERPQDHGVQYAKNSSIRSDAERQRGNDDR